MTQPAAIERDKPRDADRRSAPQPQTDATPVARRVVVEAPAVERVRNVGGRLMA
jgi:hypothetical protein